MKRRYIIFIAFLLLTNCSKSPFEPTIFTDVCYDTFSDREGGGTVTIRSVDDPIVIPKLSETLLDTIF